MAKKYYGSISNRRVPFIILLLTVVIALYAEDGGIPEPAASPAEDGTKFSINIGVHSNFDGSGAVYFENGEVYGGFDEWVNAHINGDIGEYISYSFSIGVSLLAANRPYLGKYQTNVDSQDSFDVYGAPLGYFPYTYRSQWDGFVFPITALNAAGPSGWPDNLSIGFSLLCEISGSAFNDALTWSLGRRNREIAGMVEGGSLVLNKFAQPFFGIELSFSPFPWFGVSSLVGMLEYFDSQGIQESSKTFQNAFSVSMVEFNYLNYFHIDVGATAVWPKRFELGYLFPLLSPLLYQNNIGDFDNIGLFGSVKLQKPGLGFLWASLFIDEINFEKDFFTLDREMYALQAGMRVSLPILAFTSLVISYTKIEPYCYTHHKTNVPWYNAPMEEASMNHGYGLGYYLPPNSDELKVLFQTMLNISTTLNAQFQMIRHGADYGTRAVDGSSYLSELGGDRSENPMLRKFFLHDGAYQWFYILKAGVKHKLRNLPLELSLESGIVFSYWTDINASPNDGSSHPFQITDNVNYPKRTGIIAHIGIKIFP
jgi:hypothetical protein